MKEKSFIEKYEEVIGRKLSNEEENKILKVKNVFNIHENDALWEIIIIFDYFTKICQDTPSQVESILKEFTQNNKNNEIEYTVQSNDNKINLSHIIYLILSSIFFTFLGYNLANYNFTVLLLLAKVFLTGLSFLVTLFFAVQYIKYALASNKKWIKSIFYSALALASTLFFFVIM